MEATLTEVLQEVRAEAKIRRDGYLRGGSAKHEELRRAMLRTILEEWAPLRDPGYASGRLDMSPEEIIEDMASLLHCREDARSVGEALQTASLERLMQVASVLELEVSLLLREAVRSHD